MSKIHIKSIFEQISETVFTSNVSLNETKQFIVSFVNKKEINDKDKKMIINNVNASPTLIRLQMYIANSLLQYEGLGMNQLSKTKDKEVIINKEKNEHIHI